MSQKSIQQWMVVVNSIFESGNLGAVYQPIMQLHDQANLQTILGYEALARPLGIDPDQSVEGLFEAANQMGKIRDLDWLCRRVALEGSAALPLDVPVFINLGSKMLTDPLHDVDQMLLLLDWSKRPTNTVVLEITERDAVVDVERLRYVIEQYRHFGFRFALDDVGEGHSTLEVMVGTLPEYIKIASSLVAAINEPGARAAIEAIVAFARSTGATVIAEGIESRAEVVALTQLGVEAGQGFWLSKPLVFEQKTGLYIVETEETG